jgi:hypothetical protein
MKTDPSTVRQSVVGQEAKKMITTLPEVLTSLLLSVGMPQDDTSACVKSDNDHHHSTASKNSLPYLLPCKPNPFLGKGAPMPVA